VGGCAPARNARGIPPFRINLPPVQRVRLGAADGGPYASAGGAPRQSHLKWTFVRQPPRKLTVLASIDVAGFTRLIQDDERGTLSQLAALRNDMLNPLLTAYGGDMFKTMGDGGLIEFPSVEDSVRWAIDFQTAMAKHNRGRGQEALMVRLAIALADVIVADGDRYGAAVAFVVRLQEVAPPGGVVITHSVRWQLLKALSDKFAKMEPLNLKSIDEPIEAWCWMPDGIAPLTVEPPRAPQRIAELANPPPDRPSIAVLALDVLSEDADAEHIADGIVEEITATLTSARSRAISSAKTCRSSDQNAATMALRFSGRSRRI